MKKRPFLHSLGGRIVALIKPQFEAGKAEADHLRVEHLAVGQVEESERTAVGVAVVGAGPVVRLEADGLAIHQDGASAALAFSTAVLGSGQAKVVSEHPE